MRGDRSMNSLTIGALNLPCAQPTKPNLLSPRTEFHFSWGVNLFQLSKAQNPLSFSLYISYWLVKNGMMIPPSILPGKIRKVYLELPNQTVIHPQSSKAGPTQLPDWMLSKHFSASTTTSVQGKAQKVLGKTLKICILGRDGKRNDEVINMLNGLWYFKMHSPGLFVADDPGYGGLGYRT